MKTIEQVIQAPQYDFLRTDPHLGAQLMFVTFGGAYAYGYPTEFSDVEIRGCTLNTPADLLGRTGFERFRDKDTGTYIHSFVKTANLLASGDLVTSELLGMDQYAMVSPAGARLIKNAPLFLSQRVSGAYVSYIYTLTEWLGNIQSRLNLGTMPSEKKLLAACQPPIQKFNKRFEDAQDGSARLYMAPAKTPGLSQEIHMDISFRERPLRECLELLEALQNTMQRYEKAAAQRRALDVHYIGQKNATLVRSLLTCCELLETGRLVTCRKADAPLLAELREGKFVEPNCRLKDELFDIVNPLLRRLEYARAYTVLAEEPDEEAVDAFVMQMNREAVEGSLTPEGAGLI